MSLPFIAVGHGQPPVIDVQFNRLKVRVKRLILSDFAISETLIS